MTRTAHATVVGLTPIAPRPPARPSSPKRLVPAPMSALLGRVIDIVVDEVWSSGNGTPRERARLVRNELWYQLVFQQHRNVEALAPRVLDSGALVIAATIDGAAFQRRYLAPRDGAR